MGEAGSIWSACGEDGAWLRAELDDLLCAYDEEEADRILISLERFLEISGRPTVSARTLRHNPVGLQLLVDLAAVSRWGMEVLRLLPGVFWDIYQNQDHHKVWGRRLLLEDIRRRLAAIDSYEHRLNAIIRFNHYHLLRIMLGDMSGEMGFESVVGEIAAVADACIEAALDLARQKIAGRYGEADCRFVVFGLGKLGGRELNYSSDIDLIFAYERRGETSGGPRSTDHHDYFRRIGSELIRLLGDLHEEGKLYRVDMRLRPEGNAGELVLTRQQVIDYYYAVGRPWERQALIKARPVAGDLALGDEILAELRPWIFPRDHSIGDLDQTRVMRRRIEERADEYNVKTGAGGIRDIEFLVQFYQLGFAGHNRELRTPTTLRALRELNQLSLLSSEDGTELDQHYRWLRIVEHRLQMFEFRQLHHVPEDAVERATLALRCGYQGPDRLARFDADFDRTRRRVRQLARKHYLDDDEGADAILAMLTNEHPSDELVAQVLGEVGFSDPHAALEHLRGMAEEPFFILSRNRTRWHLALLLPALLDQFERSPDPDLALRNFRRITDAVGGRSIFYGLLLERPRLLAMLCELAGWSNFVVAELTRFPGLPDELAEHLRPDQPLAVRDLEQEGEELIQGLHDPVEALAYMKARELVLIALNDLRGCPPEETSFALSRLATAVLRVVLDRCIAEMDEKWGRPVLADGRQARLAVLGLGKLGSQELSYASDMDIILVADRGGRCPRNDRDGESFWQRVCKRLIQICHQGQLYPIDLRLRPWGDQGEVVSSLAQLRKYWDQPRELWERMAMTRIAPVAGDGELGLEAAKLVRDAALTQPLPGDAIDQVRDMRRRLEDSVAGRDHLKRGWGGYVDVEFLVHFLCMGRDPEELPAGASIDATLHVLGDLGIVPAEAVAGCSGAMAILRRVEARMRLLEGKAISSIPTDLAGRRRFARCADFPDTPTMDLALHKAREQARYWFEQLVRPHAEA